MYQLHTFSDDPALSTALEGCTGYDYFCSQLGVVEISRGDSLEKVCAGACASAPLPACRPGPLWGWVGVPPQSRQRCSAATCRRPPGARGEGPAFSCCPRYTPTQGVHGPRTALKDSPQPPPTAHCQPPPTANCQPPTIVQYRFCGSVFCPCLDHEAESVPVRVRFCWRYRRCFFSFKDSPGGRVEWGWPSPKRTPPPRRPEVTPHKPEPKPLKQTCHQRPAGRDQKEPDPTESDTAPADPY